MKRRNFLLEAENIASVVSHLFTLKITLGLLLKFSSTGLYIGRVG